jgi:hypothetical protein
VSYSCSKAPKHPIGEHCDSDADRLGKVDKVISGVFRQNHRQITDRRLDMPAVVEKLPNGHADILPSRVALYLEQLAVDVHPGIREKPRGLASDPDLEARGLLAAGLDPVD